MSVRWTPDKQQEGDSTLPQVDRKNSLYSKEDYSKEGALSRRAPPSHRASAATPSERASAAAARTSISQERAFELQRWLEAHPESAELIDQNGDLPLHLAIHVQAPRPRDAVT